MSLCHKLHEVVKGHDLAHKQRFRIKEILFGLEKSCLNSFYFVPGQNSVVTNKRHWLKSHQYLIQKVPDAYPASQFNVLWIPWDKKEKELSGCPC